MKGKALEIADEREKEAAKGENYVLMWNRKSKQSKDGTKYMCS